MVECCKCRVLLLSAHQGVKEAQQRARLLSAEAVVRGGSKESYIQLNSKDSKALQTLPSDVSVRIKFPA